MASLLPYQKVQRQDGGFDFYNPQGQKTTIENYVAGTGVNGSQLRQQLAAAGDPQSRQIIAQNTRQVTPQPPQSLLSNISKFVNSIPSSIVSGAQQAAGWAGDVATQGGAALGHLGAATNPLVSAQQRAKNVQNYDQKLVQPNSPTNQIRNFIHGQTDLSGNKIEGTAPVDQSATNIANGHASAQDIAKLAGNTLNGALGVTMFANPASLARQPAQGLLKTALKTAGRDSLFFGGTSGANAALQNYGQTGDLSQALKSGAQGALQGAASAGVMDLGGAALGQAFRAGKVAANKIADATPGVIHAAKNANTALNNVATKKHPAVTALSDHLTLLRQADDQMAANGLSPKNPARINNAKAQTLTLNELQNTQRKLSQGGYAKIPGSPKDALPESLSNSKQSVPKVIQPKQLQQSDILPSSQTSSPRSDVLQTDKANILRSPQEQSKTTLLKDTQTNQTPQMSNLVARKGAQERIGSDNPYSPNISTSEYIKQQTKLQDSTRKGSAGIPAKLQDIKAKLIDSAAPIEDTLNRAIKNGADVPLSNHITPKIDRALRADTIAGQYAKDNGIDRVIQNVPNTKEFDQYLIAKHAADLEKQGIKTGRNLEADKRLVSELGGKYEPYAKQIKQYSQGLLDKAAEYGLISKDLASHLKEKYPNYVPANRIFSENELANKYKSTGSGKASISTQSVVQKIKGSEREIESPLASLLNKTQDVISQGERNQAAKTLASYKDLPGNPFELRELKPSETVGVKDVVSFLDKGKVRRFQTTPEIAAAAKSLNKQQVNILIKMLRVPTRALRLGATGVNAGFALANIAKDLASAAINSKHPFEASLLNPKVTGQAFAAAFNHGSKSYAELLREAAGGTSFDIARDAPRQTVAKIRSEKNFATKAAYTVTHPAQLLRVVEDTIGRSEELTRAMQYYGNKEAALKKGMSEADARTYGADAARTNTVNFARMGDYGQVLNSVVPYLNAGVQGSRTLLRNIKDRPAQTLTKIAVLGTLPTVTLTAWNMSDPNRAAAYKDISESEKQGNLIIVPPNPTQDPQTGKWNVIKIPVSQELANLNNIARNVVETAAGSNTLNIGSVLGDLIGTTTSLNAQSPRQLIGQLTPQALKPGVEALTNQNLYTGNNIVPNSQKNLPAPDQYGDRTSGTAIALGKALNLSPRMIDNAVSTMLGGAGQNLINASDNLLAKTGITDGSHIGGKDISTSVSSRFFGANPVPTSDIIDQKFQTALKQLTSSSAYVNATPADRAKAVNRLQSDITAVEYNAQDSKPGSKYQPTKLTANQQALLNGTKSPDTYMTNTTVATDPASKYQSHLQAYNTAKAAGTLSGPKDYATQQSLAKESVTSQYPQAVLDFYGMSKDQQNAYFAQDPQTAKGLYDQAKQLDSELVNKGLATSKFKTPVTGAKKTSGSRKVSTASMKKYLKTPTVKAPKVNLSSSKGSLAKTGVKTTKLRVPNLKTYNVSNAPKAPKVRVA